MRRIVLGGGVAALTVVVLAFAGSAGAGYGRGRVPLCQQNSALCTEVYDSVGSIYGEAGYTGHDEPSALFYSNDKKAGNDVTYAFRLPTDPSTFPTPTGPGGAVWNFMLRPAFWFGMDVCENQSAPEYTLQCKPNSDTNIKNSPDPASPDYIGKHPGGAFVEMQFYPPGWVPWPAGVSCTADQWYAALNIDSFQQDQNNGTLNNENCLDTAGIEPVDFAWITKNGKPQTTVDPVTVFQPPYSQITPDLSRILLMNPGDVIRLHMHDSGDGLKVDIDDLTTKTHGSMTAGAKNGFRHVLFEPNSSTCHSAPYDFHPMYATSSEATRLTWTAHSYNIAFSDEIGHFEKCSNVDESTGFCNTPDEPATDPKFDDYNCFGAQDSLFVPIGGCLGTDVDFDGPPYQAGAWPGSGGDPSLQSAPIVFTSPTAGDKQFDRVAFEADLPRIEAADFGGTCNRTTGAGCTNPPPGAQFYPIFTTGDDTLASKKPDKKKGNCVWQLGGTLIPGTTNTFGGNSTAEYGPLLSLLYPTPSGPIYRYNDYRQVLSSNPCPAGKTK